MLSGNHASGGGGLTVLDSALTVRNSTVSDNLAVIGGGLLNIGTVTLVNRSSPTTPSAVVIVPHTRRTRQGTTWPAMRPVGLGGLATSKASPRASAHWHITVAPPPPMRC